MNNIKAFIKNNPKIVKRALCVILTLFVAFSIVTVWGNITLSIEKFNFETEKLDIVNDFKIAHISDYHNTYNKFLNDAVLLSLKEEKPDVIFLTGDLVDCRKTDIEKGIDFVSKIIEIAPVYYVTGNHECNISIDSQSAFDNMIEDLEELGVEVLRGESSKIILPVARLFSVFLQLLNNTQTLLVVAEGLSQALGQRHFAGVTKRRMAQVVAHSDCLRQVFIQTQRTGDGAGNAGHLQRVGHTGAVMVAFRLEKDLCLVHQAAESLGVDNAVDIPLVAGSYILKFVIFLTDAAFAFVGKSCKRIQPPMFLIFQFFAYCHKITPYTGNARYS